MFCFGVIQMIGRGLVPDQPWFWSIGFVVTAALNWYHGSKINAARRSKAHPDTLWKRLSYKTPHRFMSMPMETFLIAYLILALFTLIQS
jgi:hypothetical protein